MTTRLPSIRLTRTELAYRLGQLGLIYFAFSAFYGKAQANQGLLIILAALLLGKSLDGKSFFRDPLVVTSIAFFSYLCIRAAAASFEYPADQELIWNYASRWMLLGLFPAALVAAAFRRSPFKPHHLLGLAVLGFFLKIFRHVDWQYLYADIELYFTMEHIRPTFGHSMINLPFWALFFLLGLIIYSDDFLQDKSKLLQAARYLVYIGTVSLLAFLIIASKTRSIWILSGLFIPLCLLVKFRDLIRSKQRKVLIIIVAMALAALALVAWKRDFFLNRMTSELAVVGQIVSADGQEIPATSIGLRYYMYQVFLDEAPARLLFGWGPGISKRLLERSSYPGMTEVSHFHNIFVEIILQFGVLGLGLYATMFGMLIKPCRTTPEASPAEKKLRLFFLFAMATFCLTGLIDHMLWGSAAAYFLAFMGGMVYAPKADRYLKTAMTCQLNQKTADG